MKTTVIFLMAALMLATTACKKESSNPSGNIPENLPRTHVPANMQGNWMYGYFSMTEYWNQNPADYIHNAFEMAMAYSFDAKGTYTYYFTSSSMLGGTVVYNQSVTKGTVEVDPVTKTIKTHPYTSHYKQTKNGQVVEERDMRPNEISSPIYTYEAGTETSGTQALYLKLQGTTSPFTFLKK